MKELCHCRRSLLQATLNILVSTGSKLAPMRKATLISNVAKDIEYLLLNPCTCKIDANAALGPVELMGFKIYTKNSLMPGQVEVMDNRGRVRRFWFEQGVPIEINI